MTKQQLYKQLNLLLKDLTNANKRMLKIAKDLGVENPNYLDDVLNDVKKLIELGKGENDDKGNQESARECK